MGLTRTARGSIPTSVSDGNVHHAINPDPYRSPFTGTPEEIATQERRRHSRADSLLDPGKIAAFIAEPIQGVGGVTYGAPNYLKEAYAIVARARRPLHRRRSADRLRPHRRALLGIPELGRHARLRHDGERHRQRRAARGGDDAHGDRAER